MTAARVDGAMRLTTSSVFVAFGETGEVECWRLAPSLHFVFQLRQEGPVGVLREDFLRAAFTQAKLLETG
jgi:hypothetical protein